MRFRFFFALLAVVMAGWACNIGEQETYQVNAGGDSEADVWVGEEDEPDASAGEVDVGPDTGPSQSTGLRLRHGHMEVLQKEIGNGQLRINRHSIEGDQRLCNDGTCIYGRITP